MLVIVAPGQGSQTPGFLTPWLELPGTREHLIHLGEQADLDLVVHGTTSDEETIKDTAVAQPLIVAAGLVTWRALLGDPADTAGVGALSGHSVGEITAAAAAGVMSEDDAMSLVALRGRAMAEASAVRPTGMSAVLGGAPDEVQAVLARHGLTPANMNGAGQVVAAGTMDQLAALAADPPARARVIPLKVAGAFHTEHMSPAVAALKDRAASVAVSDPGITLVSNKDGETVTTGAEVLARLVNQVSNPVRWDLCMETFSALGVTGILELAPAGTLVGLAKRALRGVESVALKTPDDLDAARRLVETHGSSEPATPSQEG
ncbi:Malonyl CoA-acyl carrier protein transacylase [Nostocoides japonicum T1-X7]|uniref:[acyl-carrier-protein] S-malonyltransferase n=1 Tax=Nostocoides japonicum T1-X7 TaxID=1194083 RepID=A0A077M2E1_9MICO|nr:ACP S-malonyltransferase [Tetrasphaera japonica]CCH78409.1 Malonyl CoA-acyl carrier protein transacylase [Tetrasphaera japonica T1-X7]